MKLKKTLFFSLMTLCIAFVSVEFAHAQQRPGSEISTQDIPQNKIRTKSEIRKTMTSDGDISKPGKGDEAKMQPPVVRQISLLEGRIKILQGNLTKAEDENSITPFQAAKLKEALAARKQKLKELSDAAKKINRDMDRLKKELNADREMLDEFVGPPAKE